MFEVLGLRNYLGKAEGVVQPYGTFSALLQSNRYRDCFPLGTSPGFEESLAVVGFS